MDTQGMHCSQNQTDVLCEISKMILSNAHFNQILLDAYVIKFLGSLESLLKNYGYEMATSH